VLDAPCSASYILFCNINVSAALCSKAQVYIFFDLTNEVICKVALYNLIGQFSLISGLERRAISLHKQNITLAAIALPVG